MGQYFKIGEMAKLFGINLRTLRYYDEVGLLHPIRVDPDTGYRYYSVEQFEQLNTIRYLRTQNVSVADIRTALTHRSPAGMRELFRRQEEEVTRRIRELEDTKARLASRVGQIDDMLDEELLEQLRIRQMPPRSVAVLNRPLRAGENMELPLRSLEQSSGMAPSYFLGKVGLTIAREDMKRGHFTGYRSLFCLLEPGETSEETKTAWLPEGLWAFLRFRGSHADAAERYEGLLEALADRGLTPSGDGVEFALVDLGLTDDPAMFITEIQIPVEEI